MSKTSVFLRTQDLVASARGSAGLSTLQDNRPAALALGRAQQAMANSPRSAQLQAVQLKMAEGAPTQFKLKMKDSGPAERTDGSESDLTTEVEATIGRGDRTEIENDIRKLENSIENRKKDQKTFSPSSPKFAGHQHRIDVETDQLDLLVEAKKALPKPEAKPKPKEEGKKPAPSASSSANRFALLSVDE